MADIPGYLAPDGILDSGSSADQEPQLRLSFIANPDRDHIFAQSGKASYYAKKFNGRRTASGRKFHNEEFTAAHRKLPFGTIVKVTNSVSGESVLVQITDRGPFSGRKRIIDLSKRACDAIGGHGVTSVDISCFRPDAEIPADHYLGYSPNDELACLPASSVILSDSADDFTAIYEKYDEMSAQYPYGRFYILVRPAYLTAETRPVYYLGSMHDHIVVMPYSQFEF